jgi:hypothetical protein
MVRFTKLDYPVWLLLGTGHYLGYDLGLLALGLVLLRCNLLCTFLCAMPHFIVIGQSFNLQPFLILTAP